MRPPVTIVTGFLGSGKTSFLRRVLEQGFGGRRVALVVNEIGDMSFDGRLLETRQIEAMVELTSGCICCSLGSSFLFAIEELIETVEPDLIVIETTGLAEPIALARQVLAAELPLDSIITLVDTLNIETALEQSDVAHWQIRAADFILLTKLDLATPSQSARARSLIRELNERALVIESFRDQLDWSLFFAPHSLADLPSPPDKPHLAHDGIESFVWQSDLPLVRDSVQHVIAHFLPSIVYRLKGHIHCSDAPWPSLVNLVCGRVDYEDTRLRPRPTYLNQLVLIGAIGNHLDALRQQLDACVETGQRCADWLARYHAE